MVKNHNPTQGKWTLTRLVKREIKHHGGEMPLEDLLRNLGERGYFIGSLRQSLKALDIEVVDGKARMRF